MSNGKIDNEKLKLEKITRLLEKGGTMLANHHECGAPLFRFQGKIVCPVCELNNKTEKGTETPSKEPEKERRYEQDREASKTKPLDVHLKDKVLNKITDLAGSLDDEQDLQRVRDKLACIELGIKILKMLENPT